jgi:hypothetical protein
MLSSKQALVLGNGAYSGKLRLESPENDARSMTRALEELGFNVTWGVDLEFYATKILIDNYLELVNAPATAISLLYYSGHGLQIEDHNYIIPVDFDHFEQEKTAKLISVQSIVDQMTRDTTVRIVLLDACRSNADARQFVGGKSITTEKDFFINDAPVSAGLAEIQAASNTFVAFAAAPGKVAYEGSVKGDLSPFTASLVKYLDAVDLPISNLTSRVRQDVLKNTKDLQRTWDSSSLLAPFYFNPGSLLLFMGNFMALVGLLLSMIPFSLILSWSEASPPYIVIAACLPAFSLIILLFGVQSVYSRLLGNVYSNIDHSPTMWNHLIACLQKGILGGYLGALPASLIISAFYFESWNEPSEPFGKVLVEITVATALTASFLSVCSLFFARVSFGFKGFMLSSNRSAERILIGAGAGGIVAGMISGALLSAYFGLIQDRPQMRPLLLLPGAVIGSSILIFSIVNFDFERLTSRRVWTSFQGALAALGGGVAIAAIVFGILYATGVVGRVIRFMEADAQNAVILGVGGAIYGTPVGLILGATVGLAIVLTERWSGKTVVG